MTDILNNASELPRGNDFEDHEKRAYFNTIVIYLSSHKDEEVGYDTLAEILKIPSESRREIFNKLWNSHPKLISGKPAFKNPMIRITKDGLEYASRLDDEYYSEKGTSLFDTPIDMTLKETCKLVFEKHLPSGSLIWHKDTFKPNPPRNLFEARAVLIDGKYLIPHAGNKTTISSIVINATSYEDAQRIMNEKNSPSINASTNINVGRDMNLDKSSQDFSPKISFNADAKSKAAPKRSKITVESIVKLITAIILGALAVLKGCNVI
jgi:hypothetical protein